MVAIIIAFVVGFIFFFSNTPVQAEKFYAQKVCKNDPQFYCYTLKKNDSWEKLFSDPEKRDVVKRLNRIGVSLQKYRNGYGGTQIAIPRNLSETTVMSISPFASTISAPGEKIIFVSLTKQAWGAYDERGNLIFWGPVSGGQDYCSDIHRGCHTKTGQFAIYSKGSADCVSTKFPVGRGGAPMPYCMYFHGGFALHGSYEVPGYNASHGCVRMYVNDARWLNQEFTQGERNVPVIISH